MNETTINLVAIIVLGLVSVAAIIAYAYGKRTGDSTLIAALGPYQAIAESLVTRLDRVLAQYGELLKPVYDLSTAAGTLIDEPTDFVAQLLPDEIEALAHEVLKYIKTLSDGQPPIETELRKTYMPGASPTYTKPSAPEENTGLGGTTK